MGQNHAAIQTAVKIVKLMYRQRAKPQAGDIRSSDTLATMFAPPCRQREQFSSFTHNFFFQPLC